MSATDNNYKPFGKRVTEAAIGAAVAILMTLLLLLAAAALIADGKIASEHAAKMVMLCVFLGALLGTLLTAAKQGRGVLTAAALRCVMYLVLLIVFAAAVGTHRIFSAAFFKSAICAAAGCVLGGTVLAYRKSRPVKRRKRR